jgi:repressor LexA
MYNRLKFLERVKQRCQELDLSERAASLKAGLSSNFLRNIRTGHARSPNTDSLQKLAAALSTTSDWLLGGEQVSDNPYRSPSALGNFDYVSVVGEVQAGTWREVFQWPEGDRYPMPVPSDTRFPGVPRFGLEIRGHSMNEIYPDGATIFCVRFSDLARGPKHGERVVVERFRAGLVEATCKELVVDKTGPFLVPRSTDTKFKPIKLPKRALEIASGAELPAIVNAGDLDDIPPDVDEIRVLALVTGCYIPQ